jgi:hypothetical protein
LVANYANWLHGPPAETDPDQPLTPAEEARQNARLLRVREENVKAFERHSWNYTGTEGPNGNIDRGSAQGYGIVQHSGEPGLEFDAAAGRWRLLFDVRAFVDTAQTVQAFVGVDEKRIGTPNYVRQPIKTGIRSGDQEISAFQPPLGQPFIEGTLPGSFGNISYSSIHAVKQGNLPGTLSLRFVLSPHPPEDVELIIEPPANYVRWMPVAGDNEKTAGDRVPIKVTLQKRGGGAPQSRPTRFTYNLWNTSREKGVCLNWPLNPEADPPPDLQFELDANQHLVVEGNDRQRAVEVSGALVGNVTVSSFDYGAYGEFEAIAELENGQFVYGNVQGRPSGELLKLPDCAPNSKVAKAFFNARGLGQLADDDDSEADPVGDGFKGDGFTLYEEYRGFMHGDDWTALDPKKKDVSVLNNLRSCPEVDAGIGIFERATGLNVHRLLREYQVRADNLINFNHTSGPHLTEQHVIRIQPGITVAQGATFANALNVGPPGKAKMIRMPPDLGQHRGAAFFTMTIAHEMLHCCNVFHHGESDPVVLWSYQPPGNQMYEHAAFGTTPQGRLVGSGAGVPITVKKEDGSVLLPQGFFKPGITEGKVDLGIAHGLHSGAEDCLMRYSIAFAYRSTADPSVRYLTGGEQMGAALCTSRDGTGVNGSRQPQSRYSWAALVSDGIPEVLKNRGDCEHQIRVSDNPRSPAPPDR